MNQNTSAETAAHRHFTLMELLITIGVIVILSAMLLPALTKAKGSAMKAVCISNMKQIGVYCQNYRDRMDGRYPQANYALSWCYLFMLSEGVFKQTPHFARNEEKDLFGLRKKSGIAWCPAGEVRWIGRVDDDPGVPEESTLKKPSASHYDFSKFVHYGLLLPGDMGVCSYRTNGPANGEVGVNTSLTEFAAAHNSYYISATDRQIRSPSVQAWMAESQFGDTSYADVEKIGYNKIRIAGNQNAGDPTRGVWESATDRRSICCSATVMLPRNSSTGSSNGEDAPMMNEISVTSGSDCINEERGKRKEERQYRIYSDCSELIRISGDTQLTLYRKLPKENRT